MKKQKLKCGSLKLMSREPRICNAREVLPKSILTLQYMFSKYLQLQEKKKPTNNPIEKGEGMGSAFDK